MHITTITGLLNEAARELADVPGRAPQDAQIGANLLSYVVAELHCGYPSNLLLSTLERRGVDRAEALAVAASVQALALRLGAWLGRHENSRAVALRTAQTHESERTR